MAQAKQAFRNGTWFLHHGTQFFMVQVKAGRNVWSSKSSKSYIEQITNVLDKEIRLLIMEQTHGI